MYKNMIIQHLETSPQEISSILQNLGRPFSWTVWYFTLASIPAAIIIWAILSYLSSTIHPEAEYRVK